MPRQLTALFTGSVSGTTFGLFGLFALAVAVALGSARPPGARATVQQGEARLPSYDLGAAAREVRRLQRPLQEISGLAFDGRGALFAHDDELARIYQLDLATGQIRRTIPFGPPGLRGDFEGLAIADARFYLITGSGTLVEFRDPGAGEGAGFRRTTTGLDSRCETEGLAYDPATRALLVPCKTVRDRSLAGRLVVFSIPLATLTPDPRPRFALPWAALGAAGIEGGFHPSSIEIHPRTGSLFLASAQEEALVEIAADGRVLAARRLQERAHPQSEGIAFGPDLSLWIADEGAGGRGTLTRYPVPAARVRERR